MPLPLALAVPAAAAGLAYVDARTSFWYDRQLLRASATAAFRLWQAARAGRLNLWYRLEERAAPGSPTAARDLLRFEGRRLTYADVYAGALRYAAWLRGPAVGVRAGDVVAMVMANSDTFVLVWWALWSLGARPAFINYNLTGDALAHCLRAATARVCVADAQFAAAVSADRVQAALGGDDADRPARLVVLTPEVLAAAAAHEPERAPDADRHSDDVGDMAMLIYTSGTTGLPKPAVVAWGKCIAGATMAEVLLRRGATPDDALYTPMPLYHASASVLAFCSTVLAGSTQALGRSFSTRTFWHEVRDTDATAIQYVGETLRYLLAAAPEARPGDDRRHRVTTAFGNGLRPDVWEAFQARFGVATVVELYAATEAPLSLWNVSANPLTAGAIGRHGWLFNRLQRARVAVVAVDWQTEAPRRDPATGLCIRVAPGEPGEMLAKLPDAAADRRKRYQGYYRDPAATQAKVVRDVERRGDAWFRTGDVVRWTADGTVYFSDRIGDTFRWKSENVSTADVSHALGTFAAVREANVYGVSLPHHDGRAGCAAVCFEPSPPDPDTLRRLARHVADALPRYARPLFLRRVDGLGASVTGTNKQQKHLLREAGARPGQSGTDIQEADTDMYWLKGDAYVPFTLNDWQALEAGRIKL